MLIFIDESGDPGLKVSKGSSKYFIVALVAFEDHDQAQAADERITLLRKEQGLSDDYEFHFANMKPTHRRLFLSALASYDFFYFGIVINKAQLTSPGFKYKESFYKYACGLIFENAKPRLCEATVIIDGNGSKEFRRQLKNYLLQRLKDNSGKCLIKKVKTQNSNRNNLLQLADMVVGSVARFYSGKKDAREYRDIISRREIDVQFWPE